MPHSRRRRPPVSGGALTDGRSVGERETAPLTLEPSPSRRRLSLPSTQTTDAERIILNENGPWSAGAVSFGVVSHRVCKCAVPVFGTGLNMVGTGSFLETERPPERCSPIALTFGLFFVLAVALPLAFDLAGPSRPNTCEKRRVMPTHELFVSRRNSGRSGNWLQRTRSLPGTDRPAAHDRA
jgi:hypothetical protein